MSLKRTAVTGFLWQILGLIGQRGAVFISSIVLARFLAAEDFGVVALSLSVVTLAELLRVGGLQQAFVAYKGDDEEARHTVFWISFTTGLVYALIMVVGAPLLGIWFEEPRAVPILRVLALTQIVDSFRMVPFSLLLRQYRFRERSISESVPVIIAVPIAIVVAAMLPVDQRAWSLVVLYLVRYTLSAIFYNYYQRHLPTKKFDKALAKQLTKLGLPILATNIPISIIDSVTRLLSGFRVNVGPVGIINLANGLTTPPTLIAHAANWTLYPILANHSEDKEKLRGYVVRSLKTIGLLSVGAIAWIIVTAPDLVPILFGQKWKVLVEPTQWLCMAIVFRNYMFSTTNAMLASGQPKPSAFIWWTTMSLTVIALLIWPTERTDPVPMCIAICVASAVAFIATLYLTQRTFELSVSELSSTVAVPIFPALLASGTVWLASSNIFAVLEPAARLMLNTVLFAVIFLPITGILLGGKWNSLLTPKAARQLLKQT